MWFNALFLYEKRTKVGAEPILHRNTLENIRLSSSASKQRKSLWETIVILGTSEMWKSVVIYSIIIDYHNKIIETEKWFNGYMANPVDLIWER